MQRPHLTAKVFRYLRTLRYKAAISRGFLLHQIYDNLVISVNQPAPGRYHTQYLDLSSLAKCCVLIKQSYNIFLCFFLFTCINQETEPTFSRSFGINLPSSFMIVISYAFVFSTSLLVR